MAQIKQTCTVANGQQIVTMPGDQSLRIKRNCIFMVESELVPYTVAADATFDGQVTSVQLTGAYLGATSAAARGVFVADFTYPDMLPTISQGDVGTAAVFTKAMYSLQDLITNVLPKRAAEAAAGAGGGGGGGGGAAETAATAAKEAAVVAQNAAIAAQNAADSISAKSFSIPAAGSACALDVSHSTGRTVQALKLDKPNCVITFASQQVPQDTAWSVTLLLTQTTGANKVTWPVNIRWASQLPPPLSFKAGAKDFVTLMYDPAASTPQWLGIHDGSWM